MAAINTGLIGFGMGGRIFHAPFVSATPGLALTAIVQRTGDTAAAEYPSARILRSAEDLLADDSIRLVVVSTPNISHFDVAKQCLLAGKNVVIDKPMTATSAQAAEIVQLAAERNLRLFAFHNRRWDGDFLTVRQLLDSGELGRLVTYEARWDRFRPIPRANTWKESDPAAGILVDLGSHLLDQALVLFGLPAAVTGEVCIDRDGSAIIDNFLITLHYGKSGPHRGLRARLSASWLAADPAPRFLLNGTRGTFRKHGLDAQEAALLAGSRPPLPAAVNPPLWHENPQSEWGTLTVATDAHEPVQLDTRRIPTLPGDYRRYYAAVRDALLGLPSDAVTGRDGLRVVRLLELARESSDAARTLPVPALD